jgi:hypothetical protein
MIPGVGKANTTRGPHTSLFVPVTQNGDQTWATQHPPGPA